MHEVISSSLTVPTNKKRRALKQGSSFFIGEKDENYARRKRGTKKKYLYRASFGRGRSPTLRRGGPIGVSAVTYRPTKRHPFEGGLFAWWGQTRTTRAAREGRKYGPKQQSPSVKECIPYQIVHPCVNHILRLLKKSFSCSTSVITVSKNSTETSLFSVRRYFNISQQSFAMTAVFFCSQYPVLSRKKALAPFK